MYSRFWGQRSAPRALELHGGQVFELLHASELHDEQAVFCGNLAERHSAVTEPVDLASTVTATNEGTRMSAIRETTSD